MSAQSNNNINYKQVQHSSRPKSGGKFSFNRKNINEIAEFVPSNVSVSPSKQKTKQTPQQQPTHASPTQQPLLQQQQVTPQYTYNTYSPGQTKPDQRQQYANHTGQPIYKGTVGSYATIPNQYTANLMNQYYYPAQQQVHQQQHNHPPPRANRIPRSMISQANSNPNLQPPSSLPHTHPSNMSSGQRELQSFFMSDNIRTDLLNRTKAILVGTNPEDAVSKLLPKFVHTYHSIYPLEPNKDFPSKVFGVQTTAYRTINRLDGLPYVIRKVNNFRLTSSYPSHTIEIWKQLQHPGIINLKEVFLSKQFDNVDSLFFSYNYHPDSETLEKKYLDNVENSMGYIREEILWSYIIQLCSALRTIHSKGLSCRVIHPSKILETGKNRIRINCVGIDDVLNFDVRRNKFEDLICLGRLIVMLACKSKIAMKTFSKSIEYISAHYTPDLKDFVLTLLQKPKMNQYPLTIDDVWSMLSGKVQMQIDSLHNYTDLLESELSKEVENGRLFRILVKLGFINERPEYDSSTAWSETGDRYLLKLFRDYTFHQVYEDGSPVINWAHVVECLNKLDIGSEERILLTSRDEKSMMVVSYKDMKKCTQEAFNELLKSSAKQQQPRSYT